MVSHALRPGTTLAPGTHRLAVAALLSRHAIVEVWQDDRALHQHLDHLHPVAAARKFAPPTARGTRATLRLDPALLAPGATITADLGALDLHGPCCDPSTPVTLVIRDLR